MTAATARQPTAAAPSVLMPRCEMERRGPLYTARSVPMRLHGDGDGYEVVGLVLAETRRVAQKEATRANAARGMERALLRIAEMSTWTDGGAASLAKVLADIGREARQALPVFDGE